MYEAVMLSAFASWLQRLDVAAVLLPLLFCASASVRVAAAAVMMVRCCRCA